MNKRLLGSLTDTELNEAVRTGCLFLQATPFVVKVQSTIGVVADGLRALYGQHQCWTESGSFVDFHVSVQRDWRPIKQLCHFEFDGYRPFTPLAIGEAYAFFEWGLNWCVSTHCHNWLSVHAAVLERGGRAVILPAPPGSGKSTLCAALMHDGWRLLSDEMALLDPVTGLLTPSARPISLKNASIELMRQRVPHAVFGPVARDTLKGTVCHMQATLDSTARANEPAVPAWIVFPQYVAGSNLSMTPRLKASALLSLHGNSFNHHVHGRKGFKVLADVVGQSDVYDLQYSNLDEALACFRQLAA